MTLLENDAFLLELGRFFTKSRTGSSGSVAISMKRYDGKTKPKPRDGPSHISTEYKCLFRAKLGSKRISTVVNPKEVNKFQLAFATTMKANMDNLKKRDRKEKTKKAANSSRGAVKATQ